MHLDCPPELSLGALTFPSSPTPSSSNSQAVHGVATMSADSGPSSGTLQMYNHDISECLYLSIVAAGPNLNLSPEEKRLYGQLFRQADSDSVGVVTGDVAVTFFEKTRLDSATLGEVC